MASYCCRVRHHCPVRSGATRATTACAEASMSFAWPDDTAPLCPSRRNWRLHCGQTPRPAPMKSSISTGSARTLQHLASLAPAQRDSAAQADGWRAEAARAIDHRDFDRADSLLAAAWSVEAHLLGTDHPELAMMLMRRSAAGFGTGRSRARRFHQRGGAYDATQRSG